MSFWLSSMRGSVVLAVAGLTGLLVCSAQAEGKPQRGRKIEESSARTSESVTNLGQISARKDSLKQLEDELSRSFHPFSPKDSLNSELRPQYVPPVVNVRPSQQTKDFLDRRRNWAFANPEDLMLDSSSKGMSSNLKNQDPTKPRGSAMEEYYNSLTPQSASGGKNPTSTLDDTLMNSRARQGLSDGFGKDDSNLPSGIKNSAQQLNKMLSSGDANSLFAPGPPRSSFSDFFGLGDNSLTPSQLEAHKSYMDQYRLQVLGGTPAPDLNSLNPGTGPSSQPSGYSGLESLSQPTAGLANSPAGLDSRLHPGSLPDVNANLLNQWNPLYTPPRPEPPIAAAPLSVPMMTVPRRHF